MKELKMSFSLSDSCYLTCVRLVVGAICSSSDADIDATEDFKLCVTESCIMLGNCGFESVEITFTTDGGVCAEVEGRGGSPKDGDNQLSLALIGALASSCNIEKSGEAISKVTVAL